MSAASIPASDQRTPVTLLTGFLGAGKTTLLNHLVHQPEMAGAAVLINEFGEIGIDHHLVDKVDETLMILDSGCLCCSVQGDLVKALRSLSDRSSKRLIPPVTRVLIETTGLADPVPVVYTLMQEQFVAARYRCDSVITAVAATHAVGQIATHPEAVRQIAMADRLLITKCDLASEEELVALDAAIAPINPSASRFEVRHGQVDPEVFFGCGIYTAAGKIPDVLAWLGIEEDRNKAGRIPLAHSHDGHHPHPAKRHNSAITSFLVDFPETVPWTSFAFAMGRILETYGDRILRAKGLMNIAGDPLPRVIHCVQTVAYPSINLAQWPKQNGFENHQGRLVFIVQDLDEQAREAIRSELRDLRLNPPADPRVSACPPATQCWLTHDMPIAGDSPIQSEGWNIRIKKLRR